MTAPTIKTTATQRRSLNPIAEWANDAVVITKRNLLGYLRQPQVLVFVFIQPIMFVLLFGYIFGGEPVARGCYGAFGSNTKLLQYSPSPYVWSRAASNSSTGRSFPGRPMPRSRLS